MISVLIFAGLTAATAVVGYLILARLPRAPLSPRALRVIDWVFRIVLAAVFIRAAVPKLIDPFAFTGNIFAYRVISPSLSAVGAVTIPAIEMLAAIALLTGVFWRGAAVTLGGMLIFFIVMIFQAILRGIDIHCGCFGEASHKVSFALIAQDYGLLILAAFPLVLERRRRERRGPA